MGARPRQPRAEPRAPNRTQAALGPAVAAPWLSIPPVRSAILIDRHLHKNGGSTMRQIFTANERAGVCQYWGYWQTPAGWRAVMEELRRALLDPERPPSSLPWLCIEVRCALALAAALPARPGPDLRFGLRSARPCPPTPSPVQAHASATTSSFMPVVVPSVVALRTSLAALAVPTRVLLVTRVREPLGFYLSFYKWKVVGLQKGSARLFGDSMLAWAPHNLQAWSMLNGEIDSIAGALGAGARARSKAFDTGAMRALQGKLALFDIVAPLEEFDAHLLMIADALGLPHIAYTSISPPQMGLSKRERLTDARVCPNMTRCRERIEQIAPWDAELYSSARAAFGAKLAAQPADFHRRLALFKASRNVVRAHEECCSAQGKCHDKAGGVWIAEPPPCVPGWRALQHLVIDDRGGACCMRGRAKRRSYRSRR